NGVDQCLVLLMRLPECLLRCFPTRDVPEQALVAHHTSLLVAPYQGSIHDPADRAVPVSDAMLEGSDRLAGQHALDLSENAGTVLVDNHAQPQIRVGAKG